MTLFFCGAAYELDKVGATKAVIIGQIESKQSAHNQLFFGE